MGKTRWVLTISVYGSCKQTNPRVFSLAMLTKSLIFSTYTYDYLKD